MGYELSASFANSSGARQSAPFSVTSGGGKTITILVVSLAAVAIIGLVVWLKRK